MMGITPRPPMLLGANLLRLLLALCKCTFFWFRLTVFMAIQWWARVFFFSGRRAPHVYRLRHLRTGGCLCALRVSLGVRLRHLFGFVLISGLVDRNHSALLQNILCIHEPLPKPRRSAPFLEARAVIEVGSGFLRGQLQILWLDAGAFPRSLAVLRK